MGDSVRTEDVRADIPLLREKVYLDAASTTPTPLPVVRAMTEYFEGYNANTGRGAYSIAVEATMKLQEARKKVAEFISASENEIVFTKNTSEAINIVAGGLEFRRGDSVVVPNIEHHSNFLPWIRLRERGVDVRIVRADENGIVDPAGVEEAVDETTRLVTITHISNALGTVQDVKEVGRIAHKNGALYMVDGAQSIGHMEVDVRELGADFAAFPGHKGTLGPVGTGFLYCRGECQDELEPFMLGGGTVIDVSEDDYVLEEFPSRFEAGTLNIAGFIGLGASVDYINRIGIHKIRKHCLKMTEKLYSEVSSIDKIRCHGDPQNIYGILSFNIDNMDPHDVAKLLDETAGVCVRSGHHCAIPAMRHLGVHESGGTVRASIHYYNTDEDIEVLAETLREISRMG
ncbi:cysteine desulfurase [Methanothermobacter sp.]|uniref:cysteine desulfurase n=1 Tax=Methanothermobacter sp. TaxID=1884223 RepID=UPI003C764C8C